MNEKNEMFEILKNGQFMLTPLESMIINKIIPFGFKLETEENIIKSVNFTLMNKKNERNSVKKRLKTKEKNKKIMTNNNITDNNINIKRRRHNNNSNIYNKKNINNNKIEGNINTYNNNVTILSIEEKCQLCFNEIIKYPLSKLFLNNSSILPSLTLIEKNIKNKKYLTYQDFQKDLREVWAYYFHHYTTNPDIYKKTFQMSEYAEQVYNKIDNMKFISIKKPNNKDLNHITNKMNSVEKEMNELNSQNNNLYTDLLYNHIVNKNNNSLIYKNHISDKAMTHEEKNALGNAIRNLNKDQLKGIIRILNEKMIENKNGNQYFEFDIDKLPTKKLRELEKYVQTCNTTYPIYSTNNINNPINNINSYNNINNMNNNNKQFIEPTPYLNFNSNINNDETYIKKKIHESLLSSDSESHSKP